MLKIGDKAPDFMLYNSEKQEVSLHNLEGKNVVLLFFPVAFSGVCTKELCSMRDEYSEYTKLNATILAVSIDAMYSLAAFKEAQGYQFDLLSDFNKVVCKQYDSYMEDFAFGMKGVAKRSAFVIDKHQVIRHIEICPSPGDLPNFEEIKNVLSTLD